MLPYYILVFVPLVIQHVRIKGIDYQKKNIFALKVFFAWVLFLLMFRAASVGNDTVNYMNAFKSINWYGLSNIDMFSTERGFVLYTWVISIITDNAQVYLAVSALICIILMLPTYLRLCEDTTLSIAIFCVLSTFVMMFSGIRQMLAISIGFLAYRYVRKKQIVPWVIVSFLAMSIHTSAIMLFLMYPLYHARITKKWLWVVFPIIIIVFIFNEQIFSVIGVYIDEYTRFDSSIEETGAYMMILLFAILGAFAFIIPGNEELDAEIIGLRNFLLIAIIIQLFVPLNALIMRMGYYFIIFIPLLIPQIIKNRAQEWEKIALFSRHIMVTVFILYFLYSMQNNQPLNVVPYSFCWEGVF